jgi:cyclopropane fatty-acyl-phospholipid synthase-like methyltransferase
MTNHAVDRREAKALPAGSEEHYSAYVGPPAQYDFMGAMQFRLACSLGLRETHKFLDFGCGSLRAGRLLIPYLNEGCYFGIEPNAWLLDEALQHEVGHEIVRRKACRFDNNAAFDSSVFGEQFDFIVAQSIFSHAGRAQIELCLRGFKQTLKPNGIVMATFLPTNDPAQDHKADDWVYPGCVQYLPDSIEYFAKQAGLHTMQIPWHHPRQTWFLFAHSPDQLPTHADADKHLTGAVLRAPELLLRR